MQTREDITKIRRALECACQSNDANAALLTTINTSLDNIENNSTSKMSRIQGAANYNMAFTYDLVGTDNILTITHTGTTAVGVETIVETITYVNAAVNGSPITNVAYS